MPTEVNKLNEVTKLNNLPDEVINMIVKLLDGDSALQLSKTSKRMERILLGDASLWRGHILRDFGVKIDGVDAKDARDHYRTLRADYLRLKKQVPQFLRYIIMYYKYYQTLPLDFPETALDVLKQWIDLKYPSTEAFFETKNVFDSVIAYYGRQKKSEITDESFMSKSLWFAAKKGYSEVLKAFLPSFHEDINEISAGTTFLMEAAKHCNASAIEALIKRGANIHMTIKDSGNYNALIYAAMYGRTNNVKMLLAYGASTVLPGDVESGFCQYTALTAAADCGSPLVVDLLLSHGMDVNEHDGWDRTALMAAAARGHLLTMQLLLSRNAMVDATDEKGDTALFYAMNHIESLELLLQYGANPNHRTSARYGRGRTPMNEAFDRPDILKMLVRYGGDVNSRDNSGDTPLITSTAMKYVESVRYLLTQPGISVDAACFEANYTALHYLSPDSSGDTKNAIEIAALLILHGANLYAQNTHNETPLMNAERRISWESMRIRDIVNLLKKAQAQQAGTVTLFRPSLSALPLSEIELPEVRRRGLFA